MTLGHYDYRVNGAQYAQLGAIGWKDSSGGNTFSPHSVPRLTGVPLVLVDERSVNTKLENEFKGELKIPVANGVDASGKGRTFKSVVEEGNYQIFTILDREKLARKIEKLPESILHPLRNNDGRIITSVVVVYDHQNTTQREIDLELGAAVSAKITGTSEDPTITLKNKRGQTDVVRIKDGYQIGYETCRIKWESPNSTTIVEIRPDKIGWDLWRQ